MTDDEIREYATTLILERARDVEFLSIHEMADGEISDEDARKVDNLITKATVTVSWPKYVVGEHLRFPRGSGIAHVITAVDEVAQTVTFVRPDDPEDNCTETFADLDAVDVRVFAVATTENNAG